MKNFFFLILISLISIVLHAQEENEPINDSIVVGDNKIDSLYREDQFYFGFTFNLLMNRPKGISQSGFSGGLQLGYLRDFPINKKRTFAIAPGVGWSVNTYGQNLLVTENANDESEFYILDDDIDYSKNRFTNYLVEFPLEFRWRSSTPDTYKFWRIYAGVKASYIYHFKSRYEGEGNNITQTKVDELNKWRYGVMFTFGYNTFNFHFYYSLDPMFDARTTDVNREIGLHPLKIGLTFYIL
ncbi:porin family protein [Mesonia sp.]|uniref:porin family protein n=1 Tax=Mesonia sp. TaxID=1960830 RepID=UPI001756E588|nr:porin family protein [Mesonia sp.]HIB38010.1 PorT family protein [Mesonia sp.]HIO27649.1 PorT family protein [Flavobacteriaceae bacterium]